VSAGQELCPFGWEEWLNARNAPLPHYVALPNMVVRVKGSAGISLKELGGGGLGALCT